MTVKIDFDDIKRCLTIVVSKCPKFDSRRLGSENVFKTAQGGANSRNSAVICIWNCSWIMRPQIRNLTIVRDDFFMTESFRTNINSTYSK